MGQIVNIVGFSERGSFTENNGIITNSQLLMVMEKFNFFKNFKKLLMGGHDEKLKNFGKSKKKTGDLYELDNSKQKNFKIEIANVIFRKIFDERGNIFLSIAQIKCGFLKLGH